MAEGDERVGEGGMVGMAGVPKKQELASIGVSPPTFSNIMEQTSSLVLIMHSACGRLKAKDEVYLSSP